MLTGISLKWLPLLVYFAVTTAITDRLFTSDCDAYLATPEKIQIFGKPESRKFIENKVAELNGILGTLRLTRAKIYGVKEHEAKRSFFFANRLFAGTKNLTDDPLKTATIFTHEYAHAVFAEHFRVILNGKKFSVSSLRQYAFKLLRQKAVNDLERPILEIGSMLMQYDELFADTFVVLATGDPNSIAHAHDFSSALELGLSESFLPEDMFSTPKWRALDFTTRLDLESWEKYLDSQLHDSAFQAQIHYRTFSPMRGIIWRRFLRSLRPEQSELFLKAFLDSASEHIVQRSVARVGGKVVSNRVLNEEFLEILARRSLAMGIISSADD